MHFHDGMSVMVKDALSFVILVTGYFSIVYFLYKRQKITNVIDARNAGRYISKLQIFLISIFALGVISQDVLKTIRNIDCWTHGDMFKVATVYQVLRLLFTILQIVFVTTVGNTRLELSRNEQFSAGVIICTNLWFWTRSTFEDPRVISYLLNADISDEQNSSVINITMKSSCFSTFDNVLAKASMYFIPVEIEFFILVIRVLIGTFQQTRNNSQMAENLQEEYCPLDDNNRRLYRVCRLSKIHIVIFLFVLSNVISLVADWIDLCHQGASLPKSVIQYIYSISHAVNNVGVLIAILKGFSLIRSAGTPFLELGDYLYLLGMAASVAYATLTFILYNDDRSVSPMILLGILESVVLLAVDFYQALYVLLLKGRNVIVTSSQLTAYVCTFICIYNLRLWILDIFVYLRWGMSFKSNANENPLYSNDNWGILNEIFMCPFSIYFRYFSFTSCFEHYRHFRKKN